MSGKKKYPMIDYLASPEAFAESDRSAQEMLEAHLMQANMDKFDEWRNAFMSLIGQIAESIDNEEDRNKIKSYEFSPEDFRELYASYVTKGLEPDADNDASEAEADQMNLIKQEIKDAD